MNKTYSVMFDTFENCKKMQNQNFKIFCQKIRQIEGESALHSWNLNKLQRFSLKISKTAKS